MLVQRYHVTVELPRRIDVPDCEAFTIVKAGDTDILDICSIGEMAPCCSLMNRWESMTVAQEPGNFRLHRPSRCIDREFRTILDKPVFLSLVDLMHLGWKPGRKHDDPHTPGGALTYSHERMTQRPHYFE